MSITHGQKMTPESNRQPRAKKRDLFQLSQYIEGDAADQLTSFYGDALSGGEEGQIALTNKQLAELLHAIASAVACSYDRAVAPTSPALDVSHHLAKFSPATKLLSAIKTLDGEAWRSDVLAFSQFIALVLGRRSAEEEAEALREQ